MLLQLISRSTSITLRNDTVDDDMLQKVMLQKN